MSGRSRACSDVTRAQPRAAASVLFSLSLGGPPFPAVARVSASGILTDDDRRRVVTPGAERPVVRVMGEDNAVGAQLVDQHRCTGRAGHLSNAAAPPSRSPGRPGEQDAEGGQVRAKATSTYPPRALRRISRAVRPSTCDRLSRIGSARAGQVRCAAQRHPASEPVILTWITRPLPQVRAPCARHEPTLIAAARSQMTASSPRGTFSQVELTAEPGDNPLYHPVSVGAQRYHPGP